MFFFYGMTSLLEGAFNLIGNLPPQTFCGSPPVSSNRESHFLRGSLSFLPRRGAPLARFARGFGRAPLSTRNQRFLLHFFSQIKEACFFFMRQQRACFR